MVSDRVRVLIGFVGKGKYEKVVYTFGDGSGVRSSFTVDALRRRLCPEELYLREDARRVKLQKGHNTFGRTEEEL